MRVVATLVALAASLALAASASALPLTPTTAPLPGSTFQGGDGNQADDSGFGDWQALQSAGRVVHLADPESEVRFEPSNDENTPGEWGLTTQGVPDKANITDVWSAVDQPGGDTFLYFGFTREAVSGDTNIAFELNRDARLWRPTNALVPCRRTGDLVVSYNVGSSGDADIAVERWTTTAADPATGCATVGSFTESSDFVANRDVEAAMSPSTIQNYLPGAPDTLLGGQFGEASLNLAKVVEDAFEGQCLTFSSVWMHSRASASTNATLLDYVAPQPLSIRTCSASGTKFFDLNGNGIREPNEPGIARFLIWADYNDDGIRQANEPFAVTDDNGNYVIDGIHGAYHLREMLLDGRTRRLPYAVDWTCSFPVTTAPGGRFPCAWGAIDSNVEPNATGRDFGDLYPAQLTIRKNVEPPGDPSTFLVTVTSRDGTFQEVVTVSDGQSKSIDVPPGTYDVTETVPPGTDYSTSVNCRSSVARRGGWRRNSDSGTVTLVGGGQGECAFVNLRPTPPGTPAISIVKIGPVTADAGDTLKYKLDVTNTGQVAFPATGVRVTDPACDAAPKLQTKNGDSSPRTLDPNDTWTYTCPNTTSSGGTNCEPSNVRNTATVTGDTGTASVTDKDTISTALTCPEPGPKPPEPEPVEPINPDNPDGPVEPDGPTPPAAGDSGDAGIKVLGARAGCLPTGSLQRLDVAGSRIATISFYANGHFHRKFTPGILQQQLVFRLTLAPGRYRITARVTFQNGSATPPVTVARTVRICTARTIRFTG